MKVYLISDVFQSLMIYGLPPHGIFARKSSTLDQWERRQVTVSQQSQPMGRQEIDSGPSLRPVRPPCLARKKFEYRVSGDELGDYANILKQ